ncbi:MAG: hypothetical protein AABY38_02805 [Planctomycetota bacterium]
MTVRNIFIVICPFLILYLTYPAFNVQAQAVQTNQIGTSTPLQSTQKPVSEIPTITRHRLEIIQYILLSFAIGASVWLILRLEKMEREEMKENKEE